MRAMEVKVTGDCPRRCDEGRGNNYLPTFPDTTWGLGTRNRFLLSRFCLFTGGTTNLRYPAYKSVTLAGDGLDKARLFGIVREDEADFPDRSIDGVIGIEKDVLSPELVNDLFPRHQLARTFHQQEQDLHGDSFKLQRAACTPHLVGAKVNFKILKSDEVRSHG